MYKVIHRVDSHPFQKEIEIDEIACLMFRDNYITTMIPQYKASRKGAAFALGVRVGVP